MGASQSCLRSHGRTDLVDSNLIRLGLKLWKRHSLKSNRLMTVKIMVIFFFATRHLPEQINKMQV